MDSLADACRHCGPGLARCGHDTYWQEIMLDRGSASSSGGRDSNPPGGVGETFKRCATLRADRVELQVLAEALVSPFIDREILRRHIERDDSDS
jgi:hypothetical protein